MDHRNSRYINSIKSKHQQIQVNAEICDACVVKMLDNVKNSKWTRKEIHLIQSFFLFIKELKLFILSKNIQCFNYSYNN